MTDHEEICHCLNLFRKTYGDHVQGDCLKLKCARYRTEKGKKVQTSLTYTEWFEFIYDEKWTDEHNLLASYVVEYEAFCERNNITPIWNG